MPLNTDYFADGRIIPSGVGGTIVAHWANSGQQAENRIQRLDVFGNLMWGSRGALLTDVYGGYVLDLLGDGMGGAYAAIRERDGAGSTRVQRISPLGARMWGAGGVTLPTTVPAEFTSALLASAGTEGVWVAWAEARGIAPRAYLAVRAARLLGDGTIATLLTVCDTLGGGGYPQIVSAELGGLFVFWHDKRPRPNVVGGSGNLFGQHLASDGHKLWEQAGRLVVPWQTTSAFGLKDATSDGHGGAYLLYPDSPSLVTTRLVRLSNQGELVWKGGDRNLSARADAMVRSGTRVFYGAAGGLGLVVGSVSEDGEFGPYVRDDGFENRDVGIAACEDQRGGAVFAWNARDTGIYTRGEVWAQRFGPDGYPLWTSSRVHVAIHPEEAVSIGIAGAAPDDYGGIVFIDWRFRGLVAHRTNLYGIHGDDGPTAVLTALASVHADVDRVELRWLVGEDAARNAIVERREPDGAWVAVGVVRADGPDFVAYDDRAVTPRSRYAYRLAIRAAGGVTEYSAETEVSVPVAPGVGLRAVAPNPTRGAATIRFALRESGDVGLDVLDAAGRRVAVLARGPHAAGDHAVVWDGRDDAGTRAAPGLYFVRWRGAGRVETTRVVRVSE